MSWRDTQQRLNALGYGIAVDGSPGRQTYGALFSYMGAGVNAATLGAAAAVHFPAYRIDTPLRVAHWLAQFGHESRNFRSFEENLNYSAERLCQVWPARFKSIVDARPYSSNPEALANKVYGGRMGNGPEDGWLFRGRGPGLTGRDNYAACEARTGIPLIANPDLASKPENFVHIASDFWGQHCCNTDADRDDLLAITVKINGGRIGLEERRSLLAKAKRVLA